MNLYELIVKLRELSGSKNKIAFLNNNSTNKLLERFLSAVYNPRLNYYMVKYEAASAAEKAFDDAEVENILSSLTQLSQREVTGNAAQELVKEFTSTISKEAQELLHCALKRDIRASVAAATLLKVWPGLIHVEPYQRCVLEKDSKGSIADWGLYISQLKADGMFVSLDMTNEHISSRNGTVFPNSKPFRDLIDFVMNKYAAISPVFDHTIEGELLIEKDGVILIRAESNGMLNSLLQSGEELPEGCKLIFKVWDVLPTAKRIYKGEFNRPYKERLALLETFLAYDEVEQAHIIETQYFNTYKECVEHFLGLIAKGEEGTIVKHPNATWIDGDNKHQIKLKIEAECDLKIVGFNPADETSKHKSTFGSLMMQSSDGLLEVGVTGLKDDMRKNLWDMKDQLIAGEAIVSVRFNDIMKPKKDGELHSLFLPRFIELRLDKKEPDSLERVIEQFEAAKTR